MDEGAQMSLVYAAGVSRLITVMGLIIFIAFHIRRSFENKEIDQMIVRPISREKFIFSYWLGFSIVSFVLVLFTTIILYLLSPDIYGLFYWSLSLFCESLITVSLVMAASLILRSTVVAVMTCIGFYVLSRMAGFLLVIVTKPGSAGFANDTFDHVSKLLPRLDFFSKTEWLIYGVGNWSEVHLFLYQAFAYVGLLLCVAIIDFKNKQF